MKFYYAIIIKPLLSITIQYIVKRSYVIYIILLPVGSCCSFKNLSQWYFQKKKTELLCKQNYLYEISVTYT